MYSLAHHTNACGSTHSLSHANCARFHMQASYAHAFAAIRQLAVSLRAALNMKTGEPPCKHACKHT